MLNRIADMCIFGVAAVCATVTQAADLTVQLTGVEVGRGGAVQVAIYRDAKAFESYRADSTFAALSRQLPESGENQQNRKMVINFRLVDVPPGQYAIHYYHDANNNLQFDSHGSEPLEGWGVSNARHMWQAPTFKKAAFTIDNESVVMPIKTFYIQ